MQTTLTMTYRSRKGARLALGFLLLLGISSARADLQFLDFSGGNGTPLTITFDTPISFSVTTAPVAQAPIFVIDELGNLFPSMQTIAGTATFSFGGVGGFTPNQIYSGFNGGALTAADVYFADIDQLSSSSAVFGDRVVLSAGTLTTASGFAGAAPADGVYDMFIVDDFGARIGTGVAIPEPATAAAWMGGVALLGVAGFRRWRAKR